jgi:hypothetical protein
MNLGLRNGYRDGHLFDPILEIRTRPSNLASQFQAEFALNDLFEHDADLSTREIRSQTEM